MRLRVLVALRPVFFFAPVPCGAKKQKPAFALVALAGLPFAGRFFRFFCSSRCRFRWFRRPPGFACRPLKYAAGRAISGKASYSHAFPGTSPRKKRKTALFFVSLRPEASALFSCCGSVGGLLAVAFFFLSVRPGFVFRATGTEPVPGRRAQPYGQKKRKKRSRQNPFFLSNRLTKFILSVIIWNVAGTHKSDSFCRA